MLYWICKITFLLLWALVSGALIWKTSDLEDRLSDCEHYIRKQIWKPEIDKRKKKGDVH